MHVPILQFEPRSFSRGTYISGYGAHAPRVDTDQPPSIQYEIRANPVTVDILVSLAYIAAAEGSLDSPLPVGMGLRVTPRAGSSVPADWDGLCDFDQLQLPEVGMLLARPRQMQTSHVFRSSSSHIDA